MEALTLSHVTRGEPVVDRAAYARTQGASASKLSTTLPSLPSEARIHDGDARHKCGASLRRRSARSSSRTTRSPPASPWPTHVPPRLFPYQTRTPGGPLVPENWKIRVVTKAVVSEAAYFLARGLCNKGTRGASQNHGACMSQTRKAVAALFAVTVSTAVESDTSTSSRRRSGCALGSSRGISIRAGSPASTRHVPLATRRATVKRRGDPPAILHRRERVTASAEAYPTSLSEP